MDEYRSLACGSKVEARKETRELRMKYKKENDMKVSAYSVSLRNLVARQIAQ
jgi:hypothetical protein